jgi:hypothetical protein
MHPEIMKALAAEHVKDMQAHAAAARLADQISRGQRREHPRPLLAAVGTVLKARLRTLARRQPAPAWKLRPGG